MTGRAAARAAGRAAAALIAAALIVAAAPVSLVATAGVALAWRAGWPPGRLYRAALWCVPMLAVWLTATAVGARSVPAAAAAPYLAWLAMWHRAAAGSYPAAAVAIAPVAIPAGLAAGGLAWSYRIRSVEAGSGGLAPGSAAAFDRRQWRHQARSARARIAAPGAVPLTVRGGLAVGAVIRAVGHPARPIAAIPYSRMRSHQVVIGTTGTGKTTLLLRLWAGFTATALRRHAAGQGRAPLLVVLDCKGGADARRIADRTRRALRMAGARSTAIWPDEASLSLWVLPPDQLTTTLLDLIEHGTGAAAYYADVMEAVVGLAVAAPGGPPASAEDLLARLDPGWLALAYSGAGHDAELALIRSAARQIGDIGLRLRTLMRRLGSGLDGPGGFGDADAWYCILEGTAEISVAEAQARALVDLLASYATARPGAGGWPGARSCWRWTSSARSRAGSRSGSCTSGPARSAWPSRCRRNPGPGWPLPRTSGTGSPRPPTAGSGCCAPRTPNRSPRWPGSAAVPTPRGGWPGPACGAGGAARGPGWCPSWTRT